jgi:hypothetical protein
MTVNFTDLMHGYLDQTLDAEQFKQLADWLQANPEHARQFASLVLLHDRLRAEWSPLSDHADVGDGNVAHVELQPARRSRRLWLAMTCAGLVLLALIGWQVISSPVLAASGELRRIITASLLPLDRVYGITALDDTGGAISQSATWQLGKQPPVDGARLYVRGPGQYVLMRQFADGSPFITGSNGINAWSIPPAGRVRVSSDLTRFRGAIPGQQHLLPCIDLRDSLEQLANAYELTVSPTRSAEGWRRLDAHRKATASGGPRSVSIWYDAATGTIQRMLMERLPRSRGGPRNVLLERIPHRALAPDFFEHTSHYDSSREVLYE